MTMQYVKNSIIRTSCLCVLLLTSIITISAQDAESSSDPGRHLNFGIGASSWGVPIYANMEFPVSTTEPITLAVGGSYQSKSESYNYYYYNATWRHTIMGLSVAGNYYGDELIGLSDQFDLYAGLQLDYYIWKTTLKDSDDGFTESYSDSGLGGLGFSGIIGGRYHFGTSKRTSLNVVLGGGTVLSSGRIGLSVRL